MDNIKTAEIFINGEWTKKEFKEIKKGDLFRVRMPDGSLEEKAGCKEFIADTDAKKNSNGSWRVEARGRRK